MPRATLWSLAAVVCLAMGGCGGSGSSSGYRIAVIPKGLTHEFWKSIQRGADRAAADLKAQGVEVEIRWDGPSKEDDAADQIKLVQTMIGLGVNGIVLAPQSSKQMVSPVRDAVDRGIPVVIIDSGLDKEALKEKPDLIAKYVATDNYNGGKLAAIRLLKVLEEQGNKAPRLLLFCYAPDSESTEQREQGFLDHIRAVRDAQKNAGQPTLTLLSEDVKQYAGATVNDAKKNAGPIINKYREQGIDGIFAVNESATHGLLLALEAAGLTKDDPEAGRKRVRLVGFDSSQPLLDGVRSGVIDGLVIQDPYRMGYLGVWMVVQHLRGYDVSPDGNKDLSTGEYVLTKENIDAEATREKFEPDLQAKRKIAVPELKKK
jgi:ribose transport system substrate-binding protein